MTTTLHAQPYDTSATGFYFTSLEDYEAKFESRLPVDEYEIQFIDGDDIELELSKLVDVTQCSLESYFTLLEDTDFSEDDITAIQHLRSCGYSLEDALTKYEDVQIFEGNINDWAYDQAEAMGLEGFALNYFDCESYVNDCKCNGDLVELSHNVWVTNNNDL